MIVTMPARPFNLHEALCPNCWRRFPDIWAYKRHQDDPDDPCNHRDEPEAEPDEDESPN